MFILEMRYYDVHTGEFDVGATLRVDATGRAMVSGDRTKLLMDLDAIDERGERHVFGDDPVAWGRHVSSRLRSGLVSAVIVTDPNAPTREPVPIDRAEAAALAGLATSTWSSMVSRRSAPAPLPNTKPARWDQHEVRSWVSARQQARGSGTIPLELR
ncbi:hypothetical protein [Dermacoccus sp. Tok2021]|uniref:hypothetical protein n=1 Tax=Dermacoccus sp. Tok2021 TaxID=2826873 RepID=UPI001CA69CC3|nr:hypothetical protein [Dermacoccus sp. Tok2021]MBZ4497956.1 hypothetical protein [Dermacoccus sp. Tok2021]